MHMCMRVCMCVCVNKYIYIYMQVCEAMEVLAQYKIIHRDLAARNVLVFSFHPKIRDHVLVKVFICNMYVCML
jgi:hypothetical protein